MFSLIVHGTGNAAMCPRVTHLLLLVVICQNQKGFHPLYIYTRLALYRKLEQY